MSSFLHIPHKDMSIPPRDFSLFAMAHADEEGVLHG
jgi:hypothetical protein